MPGIRTSAAQVLKIDPRSTAEIDQEILDELDFHIAMRTEENISQGMPADAARQAALAQFGDFSTVYKNCRRALLGARIMWQRIQIVLSVVLLGAVVLLAVQLYTGQRANQAAIDDITSALKQLAPASETGAATEKQDAGPADAPETADGPGKSYPIKLNPGDVREFKSLSINFGKLKLSGDSITVVPISTKVGVTGVVLIGQGEYQYRPEPGKEFKGHFYNGMLRFNPKDAEAIIRLSSGKQVAGKGAVALARAVLAAVWSHCWYGDPDALIPDERSIAADVFSQELGDVLFSGDDKAAVVYNFTDRQSLYEKQ